MHVFERLQYIRASLKELTERDDITSHIYLPSCQTTPIITSDTKTAAIYRTLRVAYIWQLFNEARAVFGQ